MRFLWIPLFLGAIILLASCTNHDPMEKYEELGVPKGFTKDTYKRDVMKSTKKKSGFSFFGSHFQDEQERKRKFRDVSKPMEPGTVTVFPWGGDRRRSEDLHREIRKDKNYHNTPVIW